MTSATKSQNTIHTVKAGESLATLAQEWYGDRSYAPIIAQYNALSPQHILYVGQRLVLPPLTQTDDGGTPALPLLDVGPASPGGSVPMQYNGETIETVTTTAPRFVWWQDWRVWAAAGAAMGLLWYLTRRRRA